MVDPYIPKEEVEDALRIVRNDKLSPAPFTLLGVHCICGTKTGFPAGTDGPAEITCHECGRKYKITNTGDGQSVKERFDQAMLEVNDWIHMLHNAERSNPGVKDDPEGTNTITISHTLATNLADCLRELRDTAVKGMGVELGCDCCGYCPPDAKVGDTCGAPYELHGKRLQCSGTITDD